MKLKYLFGACTNDLVLH